jgi:hypothetical protein
MKNAFTVILLIMVLTTYRSWADPIERPLETGLEYDLIAEVDVLSLNDQEEVTYEQSEHSQSVGYRCVLNVRKSLRIPANTNQWTVIVPIHLLYQGHKLPAFPFVPILTNGVPVKIACKWTQDHSWIVLQMIVSDEIWARYGEQIGTEQVSDQSAPVSESMHLLQEQNQEILDALDKIGEYAEQYDNGTLTWEELQQLIEPLEKIVHQPATFVIE